MISKMVTNNGEYILKTLNSCLFIAGLAFG